MVTQNTLRTCVGIFFENIFKSATAVDQITDFNLHVRTYFWYEYHGLHTFHNSGLMDLISLFVLYLRLYNNLFKCTFEQDATEQLNWIDSSPDKYTITSRSDGTFVLQDASAMVLEQINFILSEMGVHDKLAPRCLEVPSFWSSGKFSGPQKSSLIPRVIADY